uniref:Uncharacterized protein n=1 Tax=Fagus sylvatica TaxID=28930 RepID=A0A2N9I690_FAGSY
MVAMAEALAGSTSIPRLCTKETQKFPRRHSEGTLERIHFQLVQATPFKNFSQDFNMVFSFLRLYYNVINVVFNFLMDHIVKHGRHCPLISSTGVFEAKRHNSVIEVTYGRAEGSFSQHPLATSEFGSSNFFTSWSDLSFHFSMEGPCGLHNWLRTRFYIQGVSHKPRIYPGHFVVFPCKHILVLLQQINKAGPLYSRQRDNTRAADYPLPAWDPLAVSNQVPRTFTNGRLCVHQAFGRSGKGVPDGLMIGGSSVDSSSYRAASMKCASVWSNGEGFAAIRIGFPLSLPLIH